MSNNEFRVMKLLVGVALVLSGFFAGLGTNVAIVSWLWVVVALLFLGVTFGLLSYGSYLRGVGRVASESDLDDRVSYRINQIFKLKNGARLLLFYTRLEDETEVVMEPSGGFKKFEILSYEDTAIYLAPKKLKAKVVDGSLWTPVK